MVSQIGLKQASTSLSAISSTYLSLLNGWVYVASVVPYCAACLALLSSGILTSATWVSQHHFHFLRTDFAPSLANWALRAALRASIGSVPAS
jgi:hypothetical protein